MFTSGQIYGHQLTINDASLVTFLDNNYATALPAVAQKMRVLGLGDFNLSDLTAAVGNRGRLGTKQVLDITAGTELVIAAPPAPNTPVYFKARVISTKPEAEFQEYAVNKYVNVQFEVVLQPTDTNATVLAKLYNAIKNESITFPNRFIDVDGEAPTFVNTMTIVNGFATTGTQLFLVAKRDSLRIEFDRVVYGADGYASSYITTFAPNQVREQYDGVNHYVWMRENVKWENEYNSVPFDVYGTRTPIQGVLYSDLSWKVSKNRNDIYGHNVVDDRVAQQTLYTVWVNETACATTISNIATFLNQLVPAPVFSANVAGVYTQPVTLAQYIANV